jgi:hypothetical protein
MPLGGKLTADEIETIRLWINQGAVWDNTAAVFQTGSTEEPPLAPHARDY